MRLTPRQRASWLAHVFKAATRQHHRELRALFWRYVPPDANVIDIGAHAGQFSKLFSRMAPKGHIYAFEPSAYARSIMAPALRLNGISNVTLMAMGLSDKPGASTLHTPLKRSGSLGFGTAHLGEADGSDFRMDQGVTLTTLDLFVSAHGLQRLDFIKADIEGWEMRALKGGETALRRFLPTLYLEVDGDFMARAGDRPADLFDWLGGLGYQSLTTPALDPAPCWAGAGDYLFVAAGNF